MTHATKLWLNSASNHPSNQNKPLERPFNEKIYISYLKVYKSPSSRPSNQIVYAEKLPFRAKTSVLMNLLATFLLISELFN